MQYLVGIPAAMCAVGVVVGIVLWRRGHRWAATMAAGAVCVLFGVWLVWELAQPPEPGSAEGLADYLIYLGVPVLVVLVLIGLVIDVLRARMGAQGSSSQP